MRFWVTAALLVLFLSPVQAAGMVKDKSPDVTASACAPPLTVPSRALLILGQDGDDATAAAQGMVCWSMGLEADGRPFMVAEVSVPGDDFGIDAKIGLHPNADASLPATILLEIDFVFSRAEGADKVTSLPGILTKDQELVSGRPLVGASARVVDNSFIFALTDREPDASNNMTQLTARYLDLALVFESGRMAVLSVGMDEAFRDVLEAWGSDGP